MAGSVLLLTATIEPGPGMGPLQRADPSLRHRDYLDSLKLWSQSETPPAVFCENSGFPLDGLEEASKIFGKGFELLQFKGLDYPAYRGKGYGELGILEHALRRSKTLQSCRHVVKVSGRYHVRNLKSILAGLHAGVDVMADLYDNLRWADARVFIATRPFLERFLLPLREEVNEAKGETLERVLARAVLQAAAAGLAWEPLPVLPKLVGLPGRDSPPAAGLVRSSLHRLRNRLLRQRPFSPGWRFGRRLAA